jgi:predicted ABC-type transport system involved in lysophospholipase L1 biosynthesis ATPase subunit
VPLVVAQRTSIELTEAVCETWQVPTAIHGKSVAQSPEIADVMALLQTDMNALHSSHRIALERALVEPRKVPVADSPGEYVVVVAALAGKLLYWSDIEEGWELALLDDQQRIASRGANQFELSHILDQTFGKPDAF